MGFWGVGVRGSDLRGPAALGAKSEATQGQMDMFLSRLPYKCHLEEVASVGG